MEAIDPPRDFSICFMGHSYIRRVCEFMSHDPNLMNLRLGDGYKTFARCRGGLRVADIFTSELIRFSVAPDIVFIQLGGNDVGKQTNSKLVNNLMSLSDYLVEGVGVKCVVIGQLLRRSPSVVGAEYNELVFQINNALCHETTTRPKVHYWRHRGFWSDFSHLCKDGVHLEHKSWPLDPSSPMKKYWRSIRNAVIVHSKHLRPV